jgi:formylglycine-generating enzyme required for sulfatase activity
MAQVFISYSRKDVSFVEQLAMDLKNAGLDVWYDVSSLGGGSRWRIEIETAIRNSQFVIVILSPDSMASEWVEREFLFASNLKRKIIPLMYRSCDLPLNYLDLNYIDVQGEKYREEFADILRALTIDPANITSSPMKIKKSLFASKNITVAIGVLVVLFLIIFVMPYVRMLLPIEFGATPTSTEYPIPPASDMSDLIIDSKNAEMVLVIAGDFTIGSNDRNSLKECKKYRSDCQENWFKDESPSRVVYLDSFYIDKYEVSNVLYKACEESGLCKLPVRLNSKLRVNYYRDQQFDNYPVVYVDWNMANTFCQWRGGYLPSEAQWEKAARGTNGNTYPWGNDFLEGAVNFCDKTCVSNGVNNTYDDGYADTAPVDEYPQGISSYNAYNMSGNVWEWVADWYAVYPGGDPIGSPYFEPEKTYRVIRGGSLDSTIDLLRAANRDPRKPVDADNTIGFRCAKDATP